MIVLGIETSCDETGISVIRFHQKGWEILSNEVFSQIKIHAKYGGVYPLLAKREHQKKLPLVFQRALKKAKISEKEIELIGVVTGPGLEPCLWQGIIFTQKISQNFSIPVVEVNHIEAHIIVNFIEKNFYFLNSQLPKLMPAISLVVSGGHTQLILMEEIGKYRLIGETRDDAAGECFDKVARILGFEYPGGPAIAKLAESKLKSLKYNIKLPRPMIHQKNYDFSFSGLKTAVLYDFKSRSKKERQSKEYKIEMAREVQEAIVDVLVSKTLKAAKEFKVRSVILGGGVAANDRLRKEFELQLKALSLNFFVPPKKFCTDNGAMVAFSAFFHRKRATKNWQEITAQANLRI